MDKEINIEKTCNWQNLDVNLYQTTWIQTGYFKSDGYYVWLWDPEVYILKCLFSPLGVYKKPIWPYGRKKSGGGGGAFSPLNSYLKRKKVISPSFCVRFLGGQNLARIRSKFVQILSLNTFSLVEGRRLSLPSPPVHMHISMLTWGGGGHSPHDWLRTRVQKA